MKKLLFSRFRWLLVFAAIVGLGVFAAVFSRLNEAQTKDVKNGGAKFAKFARPDVVTAAIRDSGSELVRINYRSIDDLERAARFGRVVENYGSFAILSKRKGTDLSKHGLNAERIETTINLPGAKFDPVMSPPEGTLRTGEGAAPPERGYYVLQFGATVTDEWLDSLRDAGVEIIQYVPHQAFFVYGDSEAIGKAAQHSRVRWVGRYLADQKISSELMSFVNAVKAPTAMFDVAVFARADLDRAAEEIARAAGGRLLSKQDLQHNFFNVVRIEAPPRSIQSIAQIGDVFRIDQYERPQIEDERAAQIVSGNYSSTTVLSPPGYDPLTQFGVDGTNVTVAVSDDGISIPGDGGFYVTSTNTVDGPLRGATAGASGGHGHINASIIAGSTPFGALDPTGYNYGRGIAPKANIINIPFLKSGNTTTDQQSFDDTLNTLGPNGVRGTISNNSWGNGTNGNSYDSYAAMYDGFVQDASIAAATDPFTIIFSAGNSGTAGLTRPKVAKNVIAVANSENVRTEILGTGADNIDDLRSSSSRGLAADGRIKPDITAPGTAITGSRAGDCTSVSSCIDAHHAYSSGTSHAAPQVAGAAALFTQFWKQNAGGINPNPAVIKAAIINSGLEMAGNITNASTIPNGNEGWGRISLKNMFNTGAFMKYVDQATNFSNPSETVVYNGTVGSNTKPFRVTLVWTDPPGAGNPALVNNLDLTVNVGGTTYFGNVFTGGVSVTGGANSTIDNVENVFLAAGIPAGTPVTITVRATALNGNGVLGNADSTDQHFALVAYNFQDQVTTNHPPVDFDGDFKTDISIFRPTPAEWWYNRSSNGQISAAQFGQSGDVIAPADFTGDGKTDIAVWRPSNGTWYVLRSEDSSFFAVPFGSNGDVPAPGDFDGDSKADLAVFRPLAATWFILKSGGGTDIISFGATGDVPVVANYDGDAKADIAIFRPSVGEWWIQKSSGGIVAYQFGANGDRTVPADFTGDGKADAAFWRPSNGTWYVLRSEDLSFFAGPFGTSGDLPVPGDYDGDGKADIGVFRPSTATWYVSRSTAGVLITAFGAPADLPVPNAYVR